MPIWVRPAKRPSRPHAAPLGFPPVERDATVLSDLEASYLPSQSILHLFSLAPITITQPICIHTRRRMAHREAAYLPNPPAHYHAHRSNQHTRARMWTTGA